MSSLKISKRSDVPTAPTIKSTASFDEASVKQEMMRELELLKQDSPDDVPTGIRGMTEDDYRGLFERIKEAFVRHDIPAERIRLEMGNSAWWAVSLFMSCEGLAMKKVSSTVKKVLIDDIGVDKDHLDCLGKNTAQQVYEWYFMPPGLPKDVYDTIDKAGDIEYQKRSDRELGWGIPIPNKTKVTGVIPLLIVNEDLYRKIESGEKTIEYRNLVTYYCDKFFGTGKRVKAVRFQLGYSGKDGGEPERMTWEVKDIMLVSEHGKLAPAMTNGKMSTFKDLPRVFPPVAYAIMLGKRIGEVQNSQKGKTTMPTKFEKGGIYTFAFSRIAFWNGARYIVLKDPETGSETMPGYEEMKWVFRVPVMPFQCEWDNGCEWPEYQCYVQGFLQDCGKDTSFPQLVQSHPFVKEKLYGNADPDVPLAFEVVAISRASAGAGVEKMELRLRDPATGALYNFWADDFGNEPILPGQTVNMYPARNKDGEIRFISAAKHDKNKDFLKRQKLIPQLFPLNSVHEFTVISVDAQNFIEIKHPDVDYSINVQRPPSGTLPSVNETVKLACVGYSKSWWPRFAWTGTYACGSIPVDTLPVVDLPSSGESKYVEYKSSLVYPAGEMVPDVDKQLGQVIVRAVASFMNSEGGCVYIGVRDNGEICGIENEGALLCANSEDTTKYKQNIDGIQLKILNTIRQKLGDAAGSLVDVRFKQGCNSKHLVCEIIVCANETEIPIYADGTNLYVRYSGQSQRLEGEQAARYIVDRLRRLDQKRREQNAIDPAAAVAAAAQMVSKSLVAIPVGGTGKKPATILGRQVVVADDTSVPLERLHVKALDRIGGLVFNGIFVGEAKNWGDLYVQLLRQLSKIDSEKFERLPDEVQFRGRGGRPAFARKGSRIHLRDASDYLGDKGDIKADRRDGTRTGFYEPNGYPIRLIKHFGLMPEQFRIWTGK